MRSKRQVLTGKRTQNKRGTHIVQCDTKCNYQKEGDYEVLQKGCRTLVRNAGEIPCQRLQSDAFLRLTLTQRLLWLCNSTLDVQWIVLSIVKSKGGSHLQVQKSPNTPTRTQQLMVCLIFKQCLRFHSSYLKNDVV